MNAILAYLLTVSLILNAYLYDDNMRVMTSMEIASDKMMQLADSLKTCRDLQ